MVQSFLALFLVSYHHYCITACSSGPVNLLAWRRDAVALVLVLGILAFSRFDLAQSETTIPTLYRATLWKNKHTPIVISNPIEVFIADVDPQALLLDGSVDMSSYFAGR